MTEEQEFDKAARVESAHLENVLGALDPDDVDVSTSDGVLRVSTKDGTRIVINSHRAARQIWMAAVSTAWHFDPQPDGSWVASRTQEELRQTLAALVRRHAGVDVAW